MWKVLLAYIAHRSILLAIALLTINSKISPDRPGHTFKKIEPSGVLLKHFAEKLKATREVEFLEKALSEPASTVFTTTNDPFLWIARWTAALVPGSSLVIVLLLANLFCLFFCWEIYGLVNRMALPEVAVSAGILSLLWLTSYELSLGSSLSLTCFLFTTVLRHAIDNQWFLGGIALGLLAVCEPLVLGFLPFLCFIFWYYQLHYQMGQVVKRTLFFILPVMLVVAWKWEMYLGFRGYINSGFMNHLVKKMLEGDFSWVSLENNLASVISTGFFLAGAIASAAGHSTTIHRIAPLYMLVLVMIFSPMNTLPTRMQLASVALGGIAVISSDLVLRLIQLLLAILGGYEVFVAFGN